MAILMIFEKIMWDIFSIFLKGIWKTHVCTIIWFIVNSLIHLKIYKEIVIKKLSR